METILKVKDLSITHANDPSRYIVKDVSFEVKAGEVVALVGDNGSGKSSILKAIMQHDVGDKKIHGEISYLGGRNILEMSDTELQRFRREVAYVPQRDEYEAFGKSVTVADVIADSARMYLGRALSSSEIGEIFDKYRLRVINPETGKPEFYERACPARLSGGQQRMLSVISAVAAREGARLFIIDEPLNNLDFKNARRVSDLITGIHKNHPDSAIIMVTHCRIFPAITRLISIKDGSLSDSEEKYVCHSCFGVPNEDGFYDY